MPIPDGPKTFRELAELLRGQIEGGEYPPGEVLPPISKMVETYGLARQTVRAALNQLASDGLVRSTPRKGTVVQARTERRRITRSQVVTRSTAGMYVFPAASYPDEVWQTHGTPRRSYEPAPARVAEIFGLEPGSEVLRRRRVLSPEEEPPFQIVDTWLSPQAVEDAPQIAEKSTGPGGYLDRLEDAGHGPIAWTEMTRTRMPSAEESRLLEISPSMPVMEMTLVGRSGRTRDALEATIRVIPGDRVELVSELVRDESAAWPRKEGVR